MFQSIFKKRLIDYFAKNSYENGTFKNHFEPEDKLIEMLMDDFHHILEKLASIYNVDHERMLMIVFDKLLGSKGKETSKFFETGDPVHSLCKKLLRSIIHTEKSIPFVNVPHKGRNFITINDSEVLKSPKSLN